MQKFRNAFTRPQHHLSNRPTFTGWKLAILHSSWKSVSFWTWKVYAKMSTTLGNGMFSASYENHCRSCWHLRVFVCGKVPSSSICAQPRRACLKCYYCPHSVHGLMCRRTSSNHALRDWVSALLLRCLLHSGKPRMIMTFIICLLFTFPKFFITICMWFARFWRLSSSLIKSWLNGRAKRTLKFVVFPGWYDLTINFLMHMLERLFECSK